MKTNQKRAIEAIKLLIVERYGKGIAICCPLCPIFKSFKYSHLETCIGCPNSIFEHNSSIPCKGSKTFMEPCKGSKTFMDWQYTYPPSRVYRNVCFNRKLFWMRALPRLEDLPSKAFTKKGYDDKYFWFLLDIEEVILTNDDIY